MPCHVGTFNSPTTATSVAVTGLGFQPKALLVWSGKSTSTGFTDICFLSTGFAGQAGQFFHCYESKDNDTTTEIAYPILDTHVYGNFATAGAIPGYTGRASLTSFDSDGFTVTFDEAPGEVVILHYLALGGSSVESEVGTFSFNDSGDPVVVSGLGFPPDAVLFHATHTSGNNGGTSAITGHSQSGLGIATDTEQVAICATSDDAQAAAVTKHYSRADRAGICFTPTLGVNYDFIVDSLDGDGFTASTVENNIPGLNNERVGYLALAGIVVDIVTITQPAATGNQTYSFSNAPTAVMLLTTQQAAGMTAPADEARAWIGATDGTRQGGVFAGDLNGADPTITATNSLTDRLILMATPAATATSSTILGSAELVSLSGSDLTVNWTVTDGTARQVYAIGLQIFSETATGFVRIAQLPLEVLSETLGEVRIGQLAEEVLHGDLGTVRIPQIALEVLRTMHCLVFEPPPPPVDACPPIADPSPAAAGCVSIVPAAFT